MSTTNPEITIPHTTGKQTSDNLDQLLPKDYYDLHADLRKALDEIVSDVDSLLNDYDIKEAELFVAFDDLNLLLETVKDVGFEINAVQEGKEYQKTIDNIYEQTDNPLVALWALTQHHVKTVDDSCEIALTRQQLVLSWATSPWAEARSSEIELSAIGLGDLSRSELKSVYLCARRINQFRKLHRFDDNGFKALLLAASALRDINRTYMERTRDELHAMQYLNHFRPQVG